MHSERSMRTSPPKSNKTYLQREYWDTRFQKEVEYDWFKGYEEFGTLMNRNVKKQENVLIVGCGNSAMTEAMYKDGYRSIVSTDLSKVVVDIMAQKTASNGCEGIRWQVADMLSLPFPDGHFDVVIEKGAMDVLFVDTDSQWDPSQPVRDRVHSMLRSVHRVLAPRGLFVSITFGQPKEETSGSEQGGSLELDTMHENMDNEDFLMHIEFDSETDE